MSEPIITVIKPKVGWQVVDWKELRDYRDLFYFLVWRDVKIQYKQTVLGFLWAIIQPVFQMVVMTVVFSKLANIESDGYPYPIFNFAGLLPWLFFQQSVMAASQSLISNSSMITKVYFPRVVIPMAPVLAKLVDFGIGFGILIGLMMYYQVYPSSSVVALPLLLLLLMMTAAGIGMWLTALSIQYRDVKHLLNFLLELLKFAAPVIYPVSIFTKKFGYELTLVYGIYPMAGIVDGFRWALLGKPLDWTFLGISAASTLVLFVSGLYYFRRTEKVFADVS